MEPGEPLRERRPLRRQENAALSKEKAERYKERVLESVALGTELDADTDEAIKLAQTKARPKRGKAKGRAPSSKQRRAYASPVNDVDSDGEMIE
jgi:hypothetical protein